MQENNIKTKEFTFHKKLFVTIVLLNYSRFINKFFYFMLVGLGVIYCLPFKFTIIRGIILLFSQFIMLIIIGIPIIVIMIPLIIIYKNVGENKFAFQKTRLEVKTDFLTFYYQDGSLSKIRLSNLHHAEKVRAFYFVYLTKRIVYYIPKAAFQTEKDIQLFELMLKNKKILK